MTNNTIGIILFSVLMLAIFCGYIWLGRETARQDYKEMNYPRARKPTRAERIAANDHKEDIETALSKK